jgi:hypothetical protein
MCPSSHADDATAQILDLMNARIPADQQVFGKWLQEGTPDRQFEPDD